MEMLKKGNEFIAVPENLDVPETIAFLQGYQDWALTVPSVITYLQGLDLGMRLLGMKSQAARIRTLEARIKELEQSASQDERDFGDLYSEAVDQGEDGRALAAAAEAALEMLQGHPCKGMFHEGHVCHDCYSEEVLKQALAALKQAQAREAELREALEQAHTTLDQFRDSCDCRPCKPCGKMPKECDAWNCTSCDCGECIGCQVEDTYETLAAALGQERDGE
jgi:hypothetical protein